MGKLRWYKRDPDAALAGMMALTLEERGAYNTVLDLIYARDGAVDDDDRFIAGWLRCDVRVWRRIRTRLLDLGKLYVADGQLRNSRADAEVDRGLSRLASASDAGKASAAKRQQKSSNDADLSSTDVERTSQLSTTTTRERKKESASHSRANSWPDDYREQFWNAYPRRVGKAAAMRELERIWRADRVGWSVLLSAVRLYAEYAKTIDPRFVKHPRTWLISGGWDDELPAATLMHATGPPRGAVRNGFAALAMEELHDAADQGTDDHAAAGSDLFAASGGVVSHRSGP